MVESVNPSGSLEEARTPFRKRIAKLVESGVISRQNGEYLEGLLNTSTRFSTIEKRLLFAERSNTEEDDGGDNYGGASD